ncbi:minor tail protein [Bacillus phage Zainny]|nr:minor tail protein [Bacillus phage Zainny]
MASGSFVIGTTNPYVEGRCYWDAWSVPDRNVSKINVSVYFYRTNSGYTTKGTFTFVLYSSFGEQARNTQYFTFTNPNGGIGTQVLSTSWEQAHDASGNLSFRLSVGKDSDVFSLHNNGGDVVADKIARESTVSSQPSATLPNDIWIDLNVNNSTFRHTVELWAKNASNQDVLIETQTNVASRAYYSAVPALRQKLAQTLGNRSEMALWATAITYDANGNQVGGKKWGPEGRYYRPNLGFIACPELFVNETIRARVGSYDSRLQYRVHVCVHMSYNGGNGSPPPPEQAKFRKIYNSVSENFDITFTQAEQEKIATDTMPDRVVRIVTYQVDTMCEGVVLNSNTVMPAFSNGSINISRMAGINPDFTGIPTIRDTNAKTVGVTKNNAYIIQGQSTVQVQVPAASKAVAKFGASIVRYDVTINGVTSSYQFPATGDLIVNYGIVNAAANTTCNINAVDSRGMSTPINRIISMIPYSVPSVSATGMRKNNFEISTTISATGAYSPVLIGATNMNKISTYQYKSRVLGSSTWGPLATLGQLTASNGTYSAVLANVQFDVDKIYEIEVTIQDDVSTTASKGSFILNKGTPIAFMDAKTQSLGVNMIPIAGNGENKLQVTGSAYVSDNVKTQVLLFPKTGAENNPAAANNQYVSFRIKDDRIMMNDKTILSQVGNFPDIRLGGKFYSYSPYGTYDDEFGNIKAQDGVRPENTWGVFQKSATGFNAAILVSLLADSDPNITTVTLGGVNYKMNKNASNMAPNGAMAFTNSTNGGRMTAYFENIFSNNAGANPSRPEYKENLELLDISATDIINSNKVYSYDYKKEYRQPNHNTDKKDIGVLINKSLSLMTNDDDTAIKDYAMSSILWKGLQEANARLTKLEEATK